jgi:signal transduction histidine kinase
MSDTPQRPRRSLSRRVLWFTLAVMLATEALVFLPAIVAERQEWLARRIGAAEIAVLALPQQPAGYPAALADRTTRLELLRLAGALSIRLQDQTRAMAQLADNGMVQADVVQDLREETPGLAMSRTLEILTGGPPRRLLVMMESIKRPGALLSVVLEEADLAAQLRSVAGRVALQALAIAGITGALVYGALVLLLVRPMRRLTGSIVAFRADPERTPPIEPPPSGSADEIAVAAEELSAMQHELRAALWRNARLAAIGTAVAKVGHDLRGILSPALLAAERLQANAEPAVRRSGDIISETVERATELVKRTLEFAREGPAAPKRETFALAAVVEEAADQARALRPAVQITNETPAATRLVADRLHVLRVLANLLRNAAEAGAKSIRVTTEAAADGLAITIADDGPGLPAAVQKNLFRPFVAGGRTGGSGLGMAIARDLVRAHGGELTLVETGRTGTVFRIVLPHPIEFQG